MSSPLSIATWNINSVRLRRGLVEQLIDRHDPDIICLQETKCQDGHFPSADFRKRGYAHIAVNGGKGGYHGVAVLSRLPLLEVERHDFCGKGDPRHIAVTVGTAFGPIRIHNFYVPAGGDEPDVTINPKFAHKLAFLDEMTGWLPGASAGTPDIVVGDLNIAPYETDVWSHKALLKVVSHTSVECEALESLRVAGGWVDVARRFVPIEETLFTWWSYRAKDWRAADRGRRLDHIWAHPSVASRAVDFSVLKDARDWSRPSDHVPVIARFAL